MLQSRFIQLLRLLNSDELSSFGRYLASPYINEREKPRQLLDICAAYAPIYDSAKLSKEKVFARLFNGEPYSDIKIRQLLSYTTGKLEDYMAHLQFNQQEQAPQMALLQCYHERDAEKYFSQLYGKLDTDISQAKPDTDGYLLQYQLLQTFNHFSERQAQTKGRKLEVKLDAASDKLDLFYLTSKLRLYCDVMNYKSIVAHSGELPLVPELLAHVAAKDYSHAPALLIYYHGAHCLSGQGEGHFEMLRTLLEKHADQFAQTEARSMYGMAQNYCIRKINTGEGEFLMELLGIYRSLLQSGIILENGTLSPWDFKNIVAVGLRTGQTEWTLQFIEQYQHFIAPKHRENAVSYNMAKYYYQVKKFDLVLDMLQRVAYNDIFYNLDSKVTLLKTYYELDEMDVMLGFVDTFSTYLRRQKSVSKFHRESYLKLIKFVKKLTITPSGNQHRLDELEKEIELEPGLPDKLWLKEKLGEMRR